MPIPPPPPSESSLHEIMDALRSQESGVFACPICLLSARSVERDLRSFFSEFVNDPAARTRFRKSRGFCPHHTPLLAELGDALAVAILYADLAERTQERWQAESRGRFAFGKRQETLAPCPGCAAFAEAERRYTQALAAGLERTEVWEALEGENGFCVAHTEQVIAMAKPDEAMRLRERETRRLALLQAELEEIIRKNDYRFRGEAWGAERDAWLRALDKLRRPSG